VGDKYLVKPHLETDKAECIIFQSRNINYPLQELWLNMKVRANNMDEIDVRREYCAAERRRYMHACYDTTQTQCPITDMRIGQTKDIEFMDGWMDECKILPSVEAL